MEETLYYIKGQEETGAVDTFYLRQCILNNSLHADTLAREDGSDTWLRLEETPVWEGVRQEASTERILTDHLPGTDGAPVKTSSLLEVAFSTLGYLTFVWVFANFVYTLGKYHDMAQRLGEHVVTEKLGTTVFWFACIAAGKTALFGLFMLAIARTLQYLRTLTEQGAIKQTKDT